jgi:phosphoribosylformylglycinamidine synthase
VSAYRFCVSVMPKPGILDPQGRAVEQSLPHLRVSDVRDVRVGRRIELTVEAPDEDGARAVAERLATELFANPLIETWSVERVEVTAGAEAEAMGAVAEAAR